MIELQIGGQKTPLLLHVTDILLLGREMTTPDQPALDLSAYSAVDAGVSRRHAVLERTENGFSLVDVGSTNGSWLNAQRLTPNQRVEVRSGDQIRLAQLVLYLYFHQKQSSEQTFYLSLVGQQPQRLTTDVLSKQIIPYLNAIHLVQHRICALTGEPPAALNIRSIRVENQLVCITIEQMAEAVEFAVQTFGEQPAIRQGSADAGVKTRRIGTGLINPVGGGAHTDNELRDIAQRLVRQFQASESLQADDSVSALLPPLRLLANSPLRLSRER
jgi:hypothetical protein